MPKSNYGMSEECSHIGADAGEVLSDTPLTADARVYQTVENQAGPRARLRYNTDVLE